MPIYAILCIITLVAFGGHQAISEEDNKKTTIFGTPLKSIITPFNVKKLGASNQQDPSDYIIFLAQEPLHGLNSKAESPTSYHYLSSTDEKEDEEEDEEAPAQTSDA